MTSPATEIATIPLATGATIEDPSSPAGQTWKSTLETVSAQEGFQTAFFGRELENPSVLQLFIDWDTIDAHKKFIATPIYGPFVKTLMTIVDGPVTLVHANFTPHPPSAAITSPVTEILTAYFHEHNEKYAAQAEEAFEGLRKAPGCKATMGGWVVEEVEHEKIGDGKKGRAFVACVGWESKEAHVEFRKTEEFQKLIPLIREGPIGMEMHHTKFEKR